MRPDDRGVVGKCYGSAVVGPRGQLVIPVEARKELGMDAGTRLLVFDQFAGRGLILVKVGTVQEFINKASSRIDEIRRLLRADEGSGDASSRS
ncbi:MAG: AbrB/MazE/SpoVT family DNA-binding domain-containing protein [Dehalococcoidia bacterium]|nr:AbrB/MazE/SpoVT family DNA-binding domain-containing protein [Dehalococcoidia bacterium]